MLERNRERERGAGVIWWAAVFSPPFCRAQQIHVLSLSRSLSAAARGAGVCVSGGMVLDSQGKTLYHIPSAPF